MEQLKEEVNRLAKLINAPSAYLPTYEKSEDFARPHIEKRVNEYHWVVVERGQEFERKSTYDEKELLFWIFDAVTFEMASRLELQNRKKNEDFRVQLFKIQEELIGKIDPKYAEQLNVKHKKLLANK